jgi:hypothetical protein
MNIEWLFALRLRCRLILEPRRLHSDLEDELQFHLATLAEQHRNTGVDPAEAEFLARRKFGNPTRFQEVCRDMWTFRCLDVMRQDIRYVTRTLLRSAGFSAATSSLPRLWRTACPFPLPELHPKWAGFAWWSATGRPASPDRCAGSCRQTMRDPASRRSKRSSGTNSASQSSEWGGAGFSVFTRRSSCGNSAPTS